VRKVLDATDVQNERDMSGFEFEVATADATVIGRLTTAADGRTPPIEAVAGTYTVREIGRPSWAGGLGDPGTVTFTFEPNDVREDGSDVREIVYVNTVPPASIATAARDAADGDHVVDLERGTATIIDTVTYTSLVPGTGYVVTGELMVRPSIARGDGDHPTAAIGVITTGTDPAGATVASSAIELTEMIPTGITGSTSFVPDRPDGSIDVEFTLPADSPLIGHTVVVFQRLAVASSERVVATHADPNAAEQTILVAAPTPPTTTTTTTTTTTPATTTTSEVAEVEPPTTTLPSASTTPTTTAPVTPGLLPRTGSDGSPSLSIAAITLVLLGVALLSATRRPTQRPR